MTPLPTVCVIGAGSSGIAAVKALHERGFEFDCFDASDRVGGNWVFKNRNGMSSAYRSLHINTSRERMQFADFPMPASYPDFPHHTHIAAYFDSYVDHFGFRDRITFETSVTRAERRDGGWEVSTDRGATRAYDALIVANGHHWDPRWPEPPFPGQDRFAGTQLHAHDYTGEDPGFFRDKSVVVLGMGNSAMDIAVESSFVAKHTYLAARRGAWVIPKYLLGRPLDTLNMSPRVPFAVRRRTLETLLRVVVGDMERYGLPKPDHGLLEAHPTVSDDVLSRIAHGEIAPKPNIAALTERTVRFADGSEVDADIVVYCTGYKVTFPFFDPGLIAAPGNDLPLFRRVFHPDIPCVYFIGLLQPLGAIMPLAELQSQWVCDHLAGRYVLPPRDELLADIEAERRAMFKRYVASKRHTMQVDFDDYVLAARRERRRGAQRAAERPPIQPAVAV
jgi:dimethylaniline monooxygenase (N-oxide forming)